MKLISLWNPWATLFAHGKKTIETRSWPYRGRMPCILAVHAAKKWNDELANLATTEPFHSALAGLNLHFGCVIGLVRLVKCHTTDVLSLSPLSAQEVYFGDYCPGRFGWVCDRFAPITPIPLRGRQGLFEWAAPPEIEDAALLLREGQP